MSNNNLIEVEKELVQAMKKSLSESNSFSYYSTNILKSMNVLDELTENSFTEICPDFQSNFWKAHDHKDMKALKELNAIINITISNIRSNK